jgi:glycosyltransferase involved in cell wall biosynthesis
MDVMAHPPLTEPFGQVVVEALAVGLPTVATNVGGIPEIIKHGKTGLLVPPANPRELAAAIEKYHADPSLAAALASAGQRDVTRRFTVDQMIDGHVRCYRESISSSA